MDLTACLEAVLTLLPKVHGKTKLLLCSDKVDAEEDRQRVSPLEGRC